MLTYIEEALPSTMHLPVSSEDILYFYRYLHTHILITVEQFLLLIDIHIQDHAQQLKIYQVFNLVIPHGNLSSHHNMDTKYLDITYDETRAMEILEQQFITYQQANGQFCSINTPLQPLANPPSCFAAIYAKNKAGIKKRCSLQIRNMNSATVPTPIAPNIRILTSAPKSVSTGIMLICPDEAPRFIKTQDTHPHSLPTTSMQHYISTLPSITPL